MSEQPTTSNEVYQSFGETLRTAIMVAMEVAELMAMRRMEQARAAEHADSQQRAEIKGRLRAERQAARPSIRQAWSQAWWQRATPKEIADVYQLAAGWARTGDDYAAATADHIRAEIARRYGVEIPELAPHDDVLAALLAADPAAQNALAEPGEEFEQAAGESYRYQVRDGSGAVLGQGELQVPAGASAQDAALAALAQYGRTPGGEPGERVEQLLDAAHDRPPAPVPAGAEVAVYRGDGAAPVFVLEAADAARVRDERQTWRRDVLAGEREASPQEVLAAVLLEERSVREELMAHQAEARRADQPAERDEAQAQAAAAGERLRDLALRREAAQETAHGGNGELVLRGAALRSELDSGWWQTASEQEIAGVWRHVAEWPEGRGRDESLAALRNGVGGKYGIDIPADADPDRVQQLLADAAERRREALTRDADAQAQKGREEQAAAVASGERAETLGESGDVDGAAGEGEHAELMAQAAAQDQAAAAAAAESSDPEAAEAVSVAAQTMSGTPSERLNTASVQPTPRSRELVPARAAEIER